MTYKKLFVITAGDALRNFPAVLPQLVDHFAILQGRSTKLVDADIEDGSLHSIDSSCDRVKPGGAADRGRAIVKAYGETDVLLFDIGRNPSNIKEVLPFIRSAQAEANSQERMVLAYLPCGFNQSLYLELPPEGETLVAEGFKVRFALEIASRKVHNFQCGRSLVRRGSIPPLGKGFADLVRRDGPAIGQFLNNTPDGYGFAANHIRAWLNKCIDGGVFDDVIPNDQVVAGWFQPWSSHWPRRALDYQFGKPDTIEEVHDDELFKRYHAHWLKSRDVMTTAT